MYSIFDIVSKKPSTIHPEPSDSPGTSFEERSVWIQLIALSLTLGAYFFVAWQMWSHGVNILPPYAAVFTVAVVLLVVVLVAGYLISALASRPDGRDERDRLIEWRAESHSGWLLAVGVLGGITAMLFSVSNVLTAHLLLGSLFLSEILKLVLQLASYRRGL